MFQHKKFIERDTEFHSNLDATAALWAGEVGIEKISLKSDPEAIVYVIHYNDEKTFEEVQRLMRGKVITLNSEPENEAIDEE